MLDNPPWSPHIATQRHQSNVDSKYTHTNEYISQKHGISSTMGMLDKAKNAAKSTKLKGEIALLDRDVKSKKQKFGVELSDLLWDIEAKQKALGNSGGSKYLKSLQEKWDVAKADLQVIKQKKDEIQAKLTATKQSSSTGRHP